MPPPRCTLITHNESQAAQTSAQPQEPVISLPASALKSLLSGLATSLAKLLNKEVEQEAMNSVVESLVDEAIKTHRKPPQESVPDPEPHTAKPQGPRQPPAAIVQQTQAMNATTTGTISKNQQPPPATKSTPIDQQPPPIPKTSPNNQQPPTDPSPAMTNNTRPAKITIRTIKKLGPKTVVFKTIRRQRMV